ncbi:MAG: hypothetical protein E7537_03955 [Ruminococcaceae bacterium]|nr:hypothetical protein [Oscillospiraceae bacterium]
MKIVSFNLHGVRNDRDGHNLQQRIERLDQILPTKKADLYFFQECIKGMFDAMYDTFKSEYTVYNSYMGELMDTTVLWNRKKYECQKTGYFWLSDTPQEYSRSWDNFRRYCNYVTLKERSSGKCFTCVSVHVGKGEECTQKSVECICNYVKDITGYPTIIAGTFNFLPAALAYKIMCENYIDVNAVTAKYKGVTYHKFEPHLCESDHVDYVFVSNKIKPLSYRLIDDCYPQIKGKYPTKYKQRYPSDHYGIECEIEVLV